MCSVQDLRVTIRDFDTNRGAIIKSAKARVSKSQTALNSAQAHHEAICAEAHECIADETRAAADRVELQQQIEAAQESHAKVSA
jgi:hypothetical protein